MKVIIINASPRKNWNTAQLLKSAQEGAKSVGADTEYIDLYDLNFTGCRSCLACKRKNVQRCKCYWKDDLSPLIDKILQSDTLLIGSPIYLSNTTSQFNALFERLIFVILSYDDYSSYFKGKLNLGIFYTMNASKQFYEQNLKPLFKNQINMASFFNGKVETYASCDILQVSDYGKYSMAGFNEEHKKQVRETQFPKDLQEAFNIGVKLGKQ